MKIDDLEQLIKTEIQKTLKYKTVRELAAQTGISYSHITHIKNGRRSAGGISIENLLKLFPRTEIYLTGAPAASSSIPGLSEEEQLLVDYFRALSVKGKFEAMAAIGALRAKEPAPSASANIA